jgi:hypothetical protein
MANKIPDSQGSVSSPAYANRVGLYSAILMVVITIITFVFAMLAIPISGANCPGNCVEYPYLETAAQYPKDFLWMIGAMLMMVVYVVLMVALHHYIEPQKQVFSQIGLAFAAMSALILLADYYLQFSVVPMSLLQGETQGLALLIQYNPHGVFLILEELGYLVMSLSFLFMAAALGSKSRLESAIRWVFAIGFVLVLASLAGILVAYGLARLDRFEVLALSASWLVLIINGVLLGILFGRQLREGAQA